MLVAEAAARWKVAPEAVTIADSRLADGSGRTLGFGELAVAAARRTPPSQPRLKEPSQFRLIGRMLTRTDAKAKSTGTARFTQDVQFPGLLTAVVAHSPRFGGKVARFDKGAASGQPGVEAIIEIPHGVAVVAKDFWSAKSARDRLQVFWNDADAATLSSETMLADYRALCDQPGLPVRSDGDAERALAGAAASVEARYEFPYLAHATMEPMNCVVQIGRGRCDVWYPAQSQTIDQKIVAGIVGLKPQQVFLNQLYAGGSFGRRANPSAGDDFVGETAAIARALQRPDGTSPPIKLVWTREDDMRAGYCRPAFVHAVHAGVSSDGRLIAWKHRLVGQSVAAGTVLEPVKLKDGIDGYSVEGVSDMAYPIPNFAVDLHSPRQAVPVLWWRAVGHTHTAFVVETMIDRLAQAAGQDPVSFRRGLLTRHARHLAVLEAAASAASWGAPLPPGPPGTRRGRGVAVQASYGSVVSQVAEVTVHDDGAFQVDRVVCAVDCGLAVNPDAVRAQMEGGVGFALSAALHGEITVRNGAVEQSNFHDYPVVRMNEMPRVEVHIIASAEPPTGVGEPGVPPLAPAVANALASATGQHLTRLPLRLDAASLGG